MYREGKTGLVMQCSGMIAAGDLSLYKVREIQRIGIYTCIGRVKQDW